MAAISKMSSIRSQLYKGLDKNINRTRFNGWRSLLMIPYLPFGLLLTALRLCLSPQVILMLLLVPDGRIKRFMLRISFSILGIIVTTEGNNEHPKVYVANKLSYIDNIVLHLTTDCQTVTIEGSEKYQFTFLFKHHTLKNQDDHALSNQLTSDIHDFADRAPLAIQPEQSTTNGSAVLKFRSWPFVSSCSIQPLAMSAYRLWPITITRINSSGLWDLFWTLFVPFTLFRVRFLKSCEQREGESTDEFTARIQNDIANALKVRTLNATKEDIDKWLKDPPKPDPPAVTHKPPNLPNSPVIPMSEFNKLNQLMVGRATGSVVTPQTSPEIEGMVQQVTAVMPQVPHTAIRKDLLSTHSVDLTITNILEGRVQYTPISTLQQSAASQVDRPSDTTDRIKGSSATSSLFGGTKSRSAHLSKQRQMSLEERKKQLLEQARRRYTEKHGHL